MQWFEGDIAYGQGNLRGRRLPSCFKGRTVLHSVLLECVNDSQ